MYKAVDRATGTVVLLKQLRTTTDPEHRRRFQEEASLAAEVAHPNVVRVLHVDGDSLVAEWVEGTDLGAWLNAHGPLPPDLAAFVACEAARGLAAIHAAGILHRDVSAANVLLGHDGAVKLTDFGLASLAPEAPLAEVSIPGASLEEVRGTLATLAPEIVRGELPTVASDLFSLGAVLAHALTGHPAFGGADASATLDAILHADPAAALAADPRIPRPLADAAGALLDKNPASRLGDAAGAADLLTDVLGQIGTATASDLAAFLADPEGYVPPVPVAPPAIAPEALPESSPEDSARTPRRLWRRTAALGVAALVGAVALVALLRPPEAEVARPLAEPSATAPLVVGSTEGEEDERPLIPSEAVDPASRPEPDDAPPEPLAQTEPAEPDRGAERGTRPSPEATVPVTGARPAPEAASPAETPAQTPASRTQTGTLAVVVEPWARVRVDGRDVGTTPLAPLTLPAGDHDLVLQNPDFPTQTLRVRVGADEQTRTVVSLWDLVGRVTLEVSPWARVAVDGTPWDTVPPQSRPLVLTPGSHVLSFEHPTLGTRTVPLQISAGEQRTVRVRMTDPDG